MNAQNLGGWVDEIGEWVVSGWAADATSAHAPLRIAIKVNGVAVGTATCLRARTDAVAAGFPGARSFTFDPKPFLTSGENIIEVTFDRTDQLLPNGRKIVRTTGAAGAGATAAYWSAVYAERDKRLITRWWECDAIVRRINRRVCGESLPGLSAGLHHLAMQRFAGRLPLAHGVSLGCGTGFKERSLLRCGIVERFTLFELSSVGVERGRGEAEVEGIAPRMHFHIANGLEAEGREGVYDLVYWNNSLHHMFDVRLAIEWSRHVLKHGGVFLMDDFVGPTRMQWSDRLLAINTAVRQSLPRDYLRNPADPRTYLPAAVTRPDARAIAAYDPSECADSTRILPELARIFPDAWLYKTGGGVYHLGLNDVLHNILADRNFELLEHLLQIDDACAEVGETHYAVAIAVK